MTEIAIHYGLSRERIRQVETKSLCRLAREYGRDAPYYATIHDAEVALH